MPLLRPTGGAGRGAPATAAFGEADIARLAALTKDTDEQSQAPAAKPSLMAGLPRPRVSSAPSPLTATGMRESVAPPQVGATSAPPQPLPPQGSGSGARRTVMGMALFGPGAVNAPPAAAGSLTTSELELANAPTGPAIATLDEFNQALAAATAQAPEAEAPRAPEPEPSDVMTSAPALIPAPTPAPIAAEAEAQAPAPTPPAVVSLPAREATPLPASLTDEVATATPSASSAKAAWVVAGVLILVLGVLAYLYQQGA